LFRFVINLYLVLAGHLGCQNQIDRFIKGFRLRLFLLNVADAFPAPIRAPFHGSFKPLQFGTVTFIKKTETEAFNETIDLILASQMAREYEIKIDNKAKKITNWYLQATVNKFGGIDKLRDWVGKYGVTYQDGINYFTYSVLSEELKEKATEKVRPSERQIREYFDENEKNFINPAKAVVQQIIIPTKDKDENSYSDEKVEEQRNLANKLLGLIKAGGDFDTLREKYSVEYFADTARRPGGFEVVKGSLSIAQVFEDAVFALEPGQISDVVKTYRGFHIIKLISKANETAKSFEEAKEGIAKDLEYSAKAVYFNGLMQTKKEKSVIKRLF
ncbi:MAG TPA: peptidyl-prolyl cis-trans isomerase, partial [Bacillota bacterium]|nr:peptidyl-prolyl cis-trans isomerase [Bacillota bacterium]